MKKTILLLLIAVGICSFASAKDDYHITDLNFAAPSVYGDPLNTNSKVGSIIYDLSTQSFRGLYADGTWNSLGAAVVAPTAPIMRKLTPGTGLTYTTPAGVLYLSVRMVGAGGGGAGSSTAAASNGGDGTQGTASVFKTVPGGIVVLAANGGGGATHGGSNPGGTKGTGSVGVLTGVSGNAINGTNGGGSALTRADVYVTSGKGGDAPYFAGGGASAAAGTPGMDGTADTGGGGSGGGPIGVTVSVTGGGGGSGSYVEAFISNPDASYEYNVGVHGNGGGAGTSGFAGGAGADGYIEVTEFYQ